MPQYRKLYVKSTESQDINDMPDDFTRLMWILLPLALCRKGRGVDNPFWLRSKLFPLRDDVTQEQLESAMNWYYLREMIDRYEVEGRAYFQVRNWHKYQGNTTKEADSIYPENPSRVSQELVQSNAGVGRTDLEKDRSASASVYESESESKNAIFTKIDAVKILTDSSGLSYFPADQNEWVEVVIRMAEDHGVEGATRAMTLAADRWKISKTGNGKSYRITNLSWINWAQEYLLTGSLPSQGKLSKQEQQEQDEREWIEKHAQKVDD